MAPALGIAAGFPATGTAQAQSAGSEPAWRHALSLFGDIKYPADFKRYDYVNPDAPKGGVVRHDLDRHLRQFQYRGCRDQGHLAPAATQVYETLMAKSLDEVVTEYGLLAEAAPIPTISPG